MDWTTILATLWAAINSPAGITAMAGVLIWALNKIYESKHLWQKYEGSVIAAIRFAEKNIDDATPNAGLAKLDAALQYVLKVYEQSAGRRATQAEIAQFTNGIQIVHNGLDAEGLL